MDAVRLRDVVRREFRDGQSNVSASFDHSTRRRVAFVALRELNKKITFFETLQKDAPAPLKQQAAWHVSSLPFQPPSAYLRPGAFLVSHPYMTDSFFGRSVICILEHKDDSDESGSKRSTTAGHTYGIIINRVSVNAGTGKNRTLREAFQESRLPGRLADVFGDAVIKEGGPVHASIQMIYAASAEDDSLSTLGGSVIPVVAEGDSSPALYSDRAVYFQGDVFKAMEAVENGTLDRGELKDCCRR